MLLKLSGEGGCRFMIKHCNVSFHRAKFVFDSIYLHFVKLELEGST